MSRKHVIIRDYESSDLDKASEILVDSFMSKFESLSNLDREKLIQFVVETGFIGSEPQEGHIVAEIDGEVVGILKLKWKEQKKEESRNEESLLKLISKYGFSNVVKLIFGFTLLEENVDKRTCYIEDVAVDKNFRSYGIGTKLIEYGKEYAFHVLGKDIYSLNVAKTNTKAHALYLRLGFKDKEIIRSKMTDIMFHENQWIYMTCKRGAKVKKYIVHLSDKQRELMTKELVTAHVDYLRELKEKKVLPYCGPCEDGTAFMMFYGENIAQVREYVEGDPFSKANYYKKREIVEFFEANESNNFLLDDVIEYLDNK